MPKLTPAEFGEKMRLAREAKKLAKSALVTEPIIAETLPVSKQIEQTKPVDSTMDAILKRLNEQDEEIRRLKQKDMINPEIDAKEVYKGPRNYAFSLWGGVPVTNWKTVKADPTKDLLFKNQYNARESNHYLELTLQDGTTTRVEVTLFNRDRTKTDPMPATTRVGIDGELNYIFDTKEYGIVTILSSNCIN